MPYYMSEMELEIAEIATRKAHNNETMTVSELRAELISSGFTPGSGRGFYKQISATHSKAKKEGNSGVAGCIADCITNDQGEHCWK